MTPRHPSCRAATRSPSGPPPWRTPPSRWAPPGRMWPRAAWHAGANGAAGGRHRTGERRVGPPRSVGGGPGGQLPGLLGAWVLKHQGFPPSGGSRSSRRSQNSPLCYTPAAASLPASTIPCRPAKASRGHPPTASPPAPPRLAAAQLLIPQQVRVPPQGSSGLWCLAPLREPAGFKGGNDMMWEMR